MYANAPRINCSRRLIVQTLIFSRSYLYRQVSPPETLVVKGWNYLGEKWPVISTESCDFHAYTFGFFYMPQISDMGHTALVPLRRKACWGLFSPWKIRRLRTGLNRRTWVPNASTVPLDHRSPLGRRINLMVLIAAYNKCTLMMCDYKHTLLEHAEEKKLWILTDRAVWKSLI